MTTESRYARPADEQRWDVHGAFDTTFKWEYEDGRAALMSLYEKGKNLQWNTSTRIDWSQDLDPENPEQLPDETIPIFGSDVWNRLTASEKANTRRHFQAWQLSHVMFENSSLLETVETFKPALDANGNFVGLDHEAIFYDPEAFVAPVRTTFRFQRMATPQDPDRRYTFIECLSNIYNVDGRPTQLSPSDPRFVDYYGRPWAKNWEKFFEAGWEKPDEELPSAITDIFK